MQSPRIRRTRLQAEKEFTIVQERFTGMLKGAIPLTEIGRTKSYRNINFIDFDEYSMVRPGSRLMVSSKPSGTLNASLDHKKAGYVVKLYSSTVYRIDKILKNWTEVVNCSGGTPGGESDLIELEDDAILCAGDMFRIKVSETIPYMYQVNVARPSALLENIGSYTGSEYLYRYLHSFARIEGTGNRNRLSSGAVLILETGTAKEDDVENDYAEAAWATAIGDSGDHEVYYFDVPLTAKQITHHPLYRSKNIGVGGDGNNARFFVWVDDVPACKVLQVTVSGANCTVKSGSRKWVNGDVTCTLKARIGATEYSDTIAGFTSEDVVTLDNPGNIPDGDHTVIIGDGRVMDVTQSGYILHRVSGGTSDTFVSADVGRTAFLSNGAERIILEHIDANNVRVNESATISLAVGATLQKTSGSYAFRRKWNDTVKDDGDTIGEIGLQERILSEQDDYIPLYGYTAMPDCNIGVIDSGFLVAAKRDESRYYYSNIGSKEYVLGQYRADVQIAQIPLSIRDVKVGNSIVLIFMTTRCAYINLKQFVNAGNPDYGEYVAQLAEYILFKEDNIGVIANNSIVSIGTNWMALTNEPAIRITNGYEWSKENYALDMDTGEDAVMDELLSIDHYYGVIAWYDPGPMGGYKLRYDKWEES